MSSLLRVFGLLTVLALVGTATPARAQDLVGQAEEAYLNVDFERTLDLARQALGSGRLDPNRLARVYELMGVAFAASGDEDASREAYKKMLALRPDAQVDNNLAPRLRSPFMEARGYWATRSDRLEADVVLARAERGLRIRLVDPLGMARRIVVRTRVAGEMRPMDEQTLPAQSGELAPVEGLPEADRIEYAVEVLDEAGNRLVQLGTTDTPNVVGRDPVVAGTGPGAREEGGGVPGWVWGLVGGVVAAAAIGTGLYLGLRTEPVTLRSAVVFE
ncbi:MAG: hypothetical protein H6721_25055 [Sandaracinus sp.]|nr:hypothetical protein [Sandaracinus sp.]MCB9618848.1 hypothetical protein [Sandaracinus sp.]MCB9623300.1 hypothetical protein [Sandaracinus sp.]MCB9635402.1 hypothetical protein [Sandaracinus sp.]